jgi:hypothetical protein
MNYVSALLLEDRRLKFQQQQEQLSSRAHGYRMVVASLPSISAYYQHHKRQMLVRHGLFPDAQPVLIPRKKHVQKRKFSDTNYSNSHNGNGYAHTGDGYQSLNGGAMYLDAIATPATATSITTTTSANLASDYFTDDLFFAEFRAMLEDDIESTCSGDNGIFGLGTVNNTANHNGTANHNPTVIMNHATSISTSASASASGVLTVPLPIAVSAVVPSIDRSVFSTLSTSMSTTSSSSSTCSSQEMREFCQSLLLQDTLSSSSSSTSLSMSSGGSSQEATPLALADADDAAATTITTTSSNAMNSAMNHAITTTTAADTIAVGITKPYTTAVDIDVGTVHGTDRDGLATTYRGFHNVIQV